MTGNQAPESPGGSGGTIPLNLRSIHRKTRNMHDPEIIIPAGTYQATPSVLAYPFFVEAARHECSNHDQPQFLEVGRYDDPAEPDTLTLRPTLTGNDATTTCRWDLKKVPLSIDMLPIILSCNLHVPDQTNVAIPVSHKSLPNGTQVVLLHIGRLSYRLVQKGKQKEAASDSSSASS